MPLKSAAAVFLLAAGAAQAAPSCRGISATALAFGAYDVFAATPIDLSGTLSYSCPPPSLPAVTFSEGNSGSFNPRAMAGPSANLLSYNIYVDAAHNQIWGSTPVPVPAGNGLSVPFYGRVFAQQDVQGGSYSDTVVVTFFF